MGADEATVELLGLLPEEFTGRRNELVKFLKAAGKKAEAARLAAVRRPAIHVWAANHFARRRGLAVTRLLSAAADLSDAQAKAFAGESGAGERLRRDSGAYQRALDLAVREAAGLLRESDRPPAEETVRRLRDVLAGAALGDEDLRARLAAGVLLEDPPAPGAAAFSFTGVLGEVAPRPSRREAAPAKPKKAPAADVPSPPVGREEHRRQLEARKLAESTAATARRLAEVARRARRRADAAAAEAASADREATEDEARAERAAAEADAAAAILRDLQGDA